MQPFELPASPDSAAPKGLISDHAPPEWPVAWQVPASGEWAATVQAVRQLQGPWVLVFDARDLPNGLQRFHAVSELCRGLVPLIVLTNPACPPDAAWWQAGALECCADTDPSHLPQVLARAEAAATSPMGSFVRLRQLQLNQQALQASLDNLPTPIFVKDAQGIYIECNQAFETYLGLPREKIIGATVYQVAPPNLAKIYDQADRQLLTSRGRQVYEAQVRWADGSLRDVTFHKAVWQDTTGRAAGQAGAIFDNTERKRLEQRLREQAETDSLTRLFNRRAFMEQATRSLANARMARHDLALMLIDIDHFKQINDTLGHAAGDAALQHLAATLRGQMRQDDVLARLGGDEFALLVSGHGDMQAVAARLPRLLASRPLEIDGEAVPVTISLGLAVIHPAQHTPASALHIADQALYQAKQQGRNQSHVIDTRARKPMAAGYIDISARTPSACMSLPRPR